MNPIDDIKICSNLYIVPDDKTKQEAYYLVFEILVNGQRLTDFTYYAVNLEELIQSIDRDGQFYIITCWCGVPECAGVTKGVNVFHNQDLIRWTVIQPEPLRTLTFTKKMYENAIRTAVKQGKKLIAEAKYSSNQNLEVVPMQNEGLIALE
ncbi:hypothetical protein [Nostoc sp.]|uniref:hypothetical protein n=1 Tax=Nostoc sp. TaxID=1180 RepID=UPI002FFB8F18